MSRLLTTTTLSLLTAMLLSACGKSSNSPSDSVPLVATPTGAGISGATSFSFTASEIAGATSYEWDFGDSSKSTTSAPTASHVYATAGTFSVKLQTTGGSSSAKSGAGSVTTKSMSGTWDVTCPTHPAYVPGFPSAFVVTMTQTGTALNGTMAAAGLTQAFTLPGSVTSPKHVSFGVETANNRWAPQDGDFYFSLNGDETLDNMTGSSFYCGSSVTAKRR